MRRRWSVIDGCLVIVVIFAGAALLVVLTRWLAFEMDWNEPPPKPAPRSDGWIISSMPSGGAER